MILEDVKVFTDRYEKGTTTTEDLFTTGAEVSSPLNDRGAVKLELPRCDSFESNDYDSKCISNDFENDGKYFFRLEFKYNIKTIRETFKIVLLMNHNRKEGLGSTKFINDEMPNIQINPMEDN